MPRAHLDPRPKGLHFGSMPDYAGPERRHQDARATKVANILARLRSGHIDPDQAGRDLEAAGLRFERQCQLVLAYSRP